MRADDVDGYQPEPVITVAAQLAGERLWSGLYPDDPLPVTAAEQLAKMLLAAAADARRTAPDQWPLCVDCDRPFEPDSSPHEDRCWACAEIADAEADR